MPQEISKIEAKEINVRDLLMNNLFEIPIYQRPFSWSEENFQALLDDIMDAMESGEESYFLGTLLLKRKDGITYEIVDGQQRLTSLIVLFSVFRDLSSDSEIKNDIQKNYLIQKGSKLGGIPDTERIRVWRDLEKLFLNYVYKEEGTVEFLGDFESKRIPYPDRASPVYHLYEAIKTFRDFAEMLDSEQFEEFLSYILHRVYFVYIITDNQSSAFRLFNVLNTRGLPLSAADVLKSRNLEQVSEAERRVYFNKWRDLEEDIGREKFELLVSYVRTIYAKEKARRELVDEFDKLFKENKIQMGTQFFDTILDYGKIYKEKVLESQLMALNPYEKVRYKTLMDLMNRFMPFSDWVPPLLFFYKKFQDDKALYKFAFNIERKFFIEWCADFTATERLTSSINLIRLIEDSSSPEDVLSMMFKSVEEIKRGRERRKIDFNNRQIVKNILLSKLNDAQFYSLKGGKMARYILLRLDMEMQEENFPGFSNIQTITVEHILPRTPQREWLRIFSEEEIREIVNKLGNLTLLNKRRNSRASNYEFRRKIESYFEVKRNPFAITTILRDHSNWDKNAFEERHKKLLNLALNVYLPEKLS